MNIGQNRENGRLVLSVEGRLDTTTAPELETLLAEALKGVSELVFDFSGLEYISSAGLRVILKAQKVMYNQGSMKLTGVSDEVKEIFEITGFDNFLKIE